MRRLKFNAVFSSLRTKLLTMSLALTLIPSLVIGTISYKITTKQLEATGMAQLKQDTLHVLALIDEADKQVKAGKMRLEDAQEMVKQEVLGPKNEKGQRPINPTFAIGKYGYVSAVNDRSVSVMNPVTEGKDFSNTKSPDGKLFVPDMVRLANNGGGYFTYIFPFPNSDQVGDKIVYVQKDPHWGWNVISSSYMVDFNAPANQVLNVLIIALCVEVILSAVISLWLANRISKPVSLMAQQVEQVARGDLNLEPLVKKGNDEISRLAHGFSSMTNHLRDLVKNISETSEQLAASAEELTASTEENTKATEQVTQVAQEIAVGAEKQVKTVDRSRSTVNDMTDTMQQIANNAQIVSTSAGEASDLSKLGSQSIQHVRMQMDTIQKTVDTLSAVVKSLGERSGEIGRIIEVITNIAQQTNLLALNAAIEAARAGESGRSFAVVAEEIRELAEGAGNSAKQIVELIKNIQEESSLAVESMQNTTTAVGAGLDAVDQVGESFAQIERSIHRVVEQIEGVSAALQQLAANAEELRTTMGEVTEITDATSTGMHTISASTEQQHASMEEIAASAQSLSRLAEQLHDLVRQFKI
ncbi:methyl-accepting chemotaxis protein [Kyrpidia sp.]|uniref:methyl-accepting chemotaxis protein n=1 Tax=Kyrpidia sp. TaxID=2073077 RepID=UPI00258F99E6|nr:methyl-accepting chemotaxis protein [Kyrpidia sp.]MCL6576135.1 methyl-accepting chemotaxis protein [Kyrpidia sp.]